MPTWDTFPCTKQASVQTKKRKKYFSLFEKSHLHKCWNIYTKGWSVTSLVETLSLASSTREKISKDVNAFSLYMYSYYLPLEKDMALHVNKPEFSSQKNVLYVYQDWLKLVHLFWRIWIFNVFHAFPLLLYCYYPLDQRMLCIKFDWNWPNDKLTDRQQWSEKLTSGELKWLEFINIKHNLI